MIKFKHDMYGKNARGKVERKRERENGGNNETKNDIDLLFFSVSIS